MTRFAQPANQAAFDAEHVDFAIACSLAFVSGTVRAHMGTGDLIIGGNTYVGIGSVGAGGFGSISAIAEKPDARDTSELYISISGVTASLINEVPQRSDWYQQFASIFFLPCDTITRQVLTPVEAAIFEGFMDQLVYTRKQGLAGLQLTVKHYDSLFAQNCNLFYTDESQKSLFPTDQFFNQITTLTNKKVVWGGTDADPLSNPGWRGGPGGPGSPGKR